MDKSDQLTGRKTQSNQMDNGDEDPDEPKEVQVKFSKNTAKNEGSQRMKAKEEELEPWIEATYHTKNLPDSKSHWEKERIKLLCSKMDGEYVVVQSNIMRAEGESTLTSYLINVYCINKSHLFSLEMLLKFV